MKTLLKPVLLALAAAWPLAVQAASSDYPLRPVTVIVPQAPGGTNDLVARFLAERLSQRLGQRFLVDNRIGAGGNIGTADAARAKPDGYTLLVTVNSTQAINPFLYKSVQFDPVRDFDPVTLLATVPYVLVAHPGFPAGTLPELIALAKAKPGEIQYASAGVGTINHLLGEMLNTAAGIRLGHVPYRGASALMSDLIAGHVPIGFSSMPAVRSHIESGLLKALGVSSPQRQAITPGIPTLAETVPGLSAELWVGLFAIHGTSPEIVARLHDESVKILTDPPSRATLAAMGAEPLPSTGDELAARLRSDLETWRDIVLKVGAKME